MTATNFHDRVRSLLDRVTYKPGWGFRVQNTNMDHKCDIGIWVVFAQAYNEVITRQKDDQAHIGVSFNVVDTMLDDEILDRLSIECLTLEDHERMEQFKVDGTQWQDPHGLDEKLMYYERKTVFLEADDLRAIFGRKK